MPERLFFSTNGFEHFMKTNLSGIRARTRPGYRPWWLALCLAIIGLSAASASAQTKMFVTLPGQTFTSGTGNSGTVTAQTAGTSFNLTLTAVDAGNHTVTTYTGTKTINYSGPGGAPTYTTSVNFVNGQATGVPTTLALAQTTTITATDGALTGVASSSVTVNIGALAKLQLLMPGETAAPGTVSGKTGTPTPQVAGVAFNVTVNGVDVDWNIVSVTGGNYTMQLSSSDTNATLSGNGHLNHGSVTFSVTFGTAGNQTLSVTDTSDNTITANTGAFTAANPGAFAQLLLLAPGETATPGASPGKTNTPTSQPGGGVFSVTVEAVDANWNLVTNAAANTIKITSSDTNAVLPANAALSSGLVNFNVTLKTAGSRTVTATDVTDGTKTANSSTITVLTQQAQTITFNALSNKVYGAASFALSATASSGLPVSFSVLSGPATLSGNTLTLTGVGTVTVQASQAGNSNYVAAPNVNQSFNVTAASLTITATNRSKNYGQTVTFAGTEFTTAGLVNSDTVTSVTLTSSGAASTATFAGSPYSIVPSAAVGTGLGNYTITYNNGSLTVNRAALSVTATNRSKTYGQTVTFAGTEFTTSGLLNSDTVTSATLTSSGAAASATVAGSPYNIVPSAAAGTGLGNYTITYNNGALTINAATLSITASNRSKSYGQTVTFAGTEFSSSGLVNSDTVTSVTLTSSGAGAGATVGGSPYNIVPSAAVGTGLTNYSISYVNGHLTVNPVATSITWTNPADITYGTALSGAQLNASGSVPGTLVYTPPAGTVLFASNAQVLSVTLTPTDTNYSGSSTSVLINVLKSGSANAVTSSTNPALPGTSVTFTATLSGVAPGSGTPTGTVQFVIDGSPAGGPANVTNGVAVYSTASLAHGAHTVTAQYAGDNNFKGSTNSLAQTQYVDTPPVTRLFTLAVVKNTPGHFSVVKLLATVSDADGDHLTLAGMDSTSANGGSITLSNGLATYQPPLNSTNVDTFNYQVSDGFGGTASGVVTVNISSGSGPTQNITGINTLTNGHVVIHFAGIALRTYSVQASTDLLTWSTIGSATADNSGQFQFEDVNAASFPSRFYRTAYP